MNGTSFCKASLAVCAFVVSALAHSQAVIEPTDQYQEALQLIEQGNTAGAIEQYQDLLKKWPNHAGAWLDLALIYCEQGEVSKAHQIFDHVEQQFRPPAALQELVTHYRKSSCVPTRAPKGRFSLTLSGGHGSNINRGLSDTIIGLILPQGEALYKLDDAFKPRSSASMAMSASYIQDIQSLPGASLFGGITEKRYPSVQELSQRSLIAGFSRQRQVGQWQQEFDIVATHLSLDERSHQTGLLVRGGVWFPPGGQGEPRFGADLALSRWRYPHEPAYDNKIIETGFNMRWALTSRLGLRGTVGKVFDLASNARPGLDRHGYFVNVGMQWLMSETYRFDAGFRQRRIRDEAAYSTLFGDRRHRSQQNHIQLGVQMEKNTITPGIWRMDWERAQSRDNIPLFPYKSRTLTLSWQYQADVF